MKDFKNTTRMVSGHTHVPASQFHTFGKSNPGHRMATGGTINRMAHGGVPHHADAVHGLSNPAGQLTERDPSHNFTGSSAVHRKVPSTEELAEHGGKGELTPGYKSGGKAHHFHVHKHYHMGGKTKSEHMAYGGSMRKMEMQAEHEASTHYEPSGHTGNTRDPLRKGGSPFGHIKKGALHKDMGIPQGQKIPRGKIRSKLAHDKAEHNVKGIRRDTFALNMGKAKGGHTGPKASHPMHHGKQVGGQGQIRKGMAKGGHTGKQAGAGHIIDCTSPHSPDYKTGGTVNRMNTGGTINHLGAGGALYKRGGRSC